MRPAESSKNIGCCRRLRAHAVSGDVGRAAARKVRGGLLLAERSFNDP